MRLQGTFVSESFGYGCDIEHRGTPSVPSLPRPRPGAHAGSHPDIYSVSPKIPYHYRIRVHMYRLYTTYSGFFFPRDFVSPAFFIRIINGRPFLHRKKCRCSRVTCITVRENCNLCRASTVHSVHALYRTGCADRISMTTVSTYGSVTANFGPSRKNQENTFKKPIGQI